MWVPCLHLPRSGTAGPQHHTWPDPWVCIPSFRKLGLFLLQTLLCCRYMDAFVIVQVLSLLSRCPLTTYGGFWWLRISHSVFCVAHIYYTNSVYPLYIFVFVVCLATSYPQILSVAKDSLQFLIFLSSPPSVGLQVWATTLHLRSAAQAQGFRHAKQPISYFKFLVWSKVYTDIWICFWFFSVCVPSRNVL